MQFFPALWLSLALCLPTTANANGSHGGPSHAKNPGHVASHSDSTVPRDTRRKLKRTTAACAAFLHQNLFITTFRLEPTS